MTTTIAFTERESDDVEKDAAWKQVTSPPYVLSFKQNDFLCLPHHRGLRGYVDGYRVVEGMQLLEPGSLVRVYDEKEGAVSYVYVGRADAEIVEAGRNLRCAFTGLPIRGAGVCCSACGRILARETVEEIGQCICREPLGQNHRAKEPGEELL